MTAGGGIDPGPRPELAWLPVERLSVDPRYQRDIDTPRSRRLVERIAANFRWSRFQAVLATPVERGWRIIDGQHRVAAARLCGFDLVPAAVIASAGADEQAEAFIWANRDRVTVSAQSLYRARLVVGDPEAAAIDRMCRAAGIEVLPYSVGGAQLPAGKLAAIPALYRILHEHGEAVAEAAVGAVADAWRDERGAFLAAYFRGAALFLAGGGSRAALTDALRRRPPRQLLAVIAGFNGTAAARAAADEMRRWVALAPPPKPPRALPGGFEDRRFEDDPRALRDHGSPGALNHAEPVGRSPTGSSLA